jgi:probable rRNA maturation factor
MRLVAERIPPKRARVEVSLVGTRTMASLNRTYRDRCGPAEILTFPYAGDPSTDLEPDSSIGEIILCWPPIAAEAAERGVPPNAYLVRLLVHGLLHLRGYRHDDAKHEDAMERAERRYLRGYLDEDVVMELFA